MLGKPPHTPYMGCMAKNSFQGKDGPSTRQLRVGELIRRTMSQLLQRGEVHDPDLQRMSITVGEVRMTPDLSIATCFVLPLGGKDADLAIAALARNKGELRHLISKDVKLKVTPDLRFRIDDMYDRMDATRAMFAEDRVAKDVAAPDSDEDA
ncbi:ribosome-binding factor A [Octadecabacter temperatus]|uniref:Ribosome-binding factor A n=2 Tax=Octadecabacter temperatus TaxID=1458307 RepID=A0A0K0Y9D0_9RHOB|nr:Ribosome-binding factor A [Octadecabacter temperatus]SIO41693.1 ribosome-binding factor A [Octadecabacter temperatus]